MRQRQRVGGTQYLVQNSDGMRNQLISAAIVAIAGPGSESGQVEHRRSSSGEPPDGRRARFSVWSAGPGLLFPRIGFRLAGGRPCAHVPTAWQGLNGKPTQLGQRAHRAPRPNGRAAHTDCAGPRFAPCLDRVADAGGGERRAAPRSRPRRLPLRSAWLGGWRRTGRACRGGFRVAGERIDVRLDN
jgi:hypothetical protein